MVWEWAVRGVAQGPQVVLLSWGWAVRDCRRIAGLSGCCKSKGGFVAGVLKGSGCVVGWLQEVWV